MKSELKRFYQRAAGMLRHAGITPTSAHKGRTLITLLMMLLTTATAWADTGNEADGVYYIGADGMLKNTATDGIAGNNSPKKISANTFNLGTEGQTTWYVVDNYSSITYYRQLTINGDVNIILCDGSDMTVETDNDAIILNGNLTIYGQSAGTGTLTANGSSLDTGISDEGYGYDLTVIGGTVNATGDDFGIDCRELTISGGTVNATGTEDGIGIHASGDITISGGTVTANGIDASNTVTISGGTVTATDDGIYGHMGGIALSYSSTSGYISAISFYVDEEEGGAITIADGMTFIDGDGNRYDHTTTTATLKALTDVTLTPDLWGVGSGADGTEAKPYVISNALELDLLAYRTNHAVGDDHAASGYEGTYFVLDDDIAYAASGLGTEESNYTAIGNYVHSFKGIFDGQHHTVSGIRIYKNPTNENFANQCQGLFGYVDNGTVRNATVRNVAVADARITGYRYIGGIVGLASSNTSVENCLVVGSSMTCDRDGGAILGQGQLASLSHNYYSGCSVNKDGTTANSNIGYNTGDITANDGAVSGILHTLTLDEGITATAIMANQSGTLSVVEGATVTLGHDRTGYSVDSYTVDDNNVDLTVTDGVYTFTMPAKDVTVTATWKRLLTHDDIADIPQQTYTGSEICPGVSVTDGETTLIQDTDYTVEYSDNVNVGTAKATITGMGNYAGSVEKTFEIVYPIVTTSYAEADGTEVNDVQAIPLDATMTTLPAGTYVAYGSITYGRGLNLGGDVTLILCDGCKMNVGADGQGRIDDYGIGRAPGVTNAALTIYGQTEGTGELNVYCTGADHDGISTDALTINGGHVKADTNGDRACALYFNGEVTINGGTVSANASKGFGIYSGNTIEINGGTVNASGYWGIGGNVIITGGTVNASGTDKGIECLDRDVAISGGTVTATGDYGIYAFKDVGSTNRDITITGGTVNASGTTSGIYADGDVNIDGGIVTANGSIKADGTITLGWTNFSDRIKASSYDGSLALVEGQKLLAEDGSDYDTLDGMNTAIAGKTLYPYDAAAITLAANAHDGNYWATFYCSYKGYKIADDENACAYTAKYDNTDPDAPQLTLYKLGKVIPADNAVIIVGSDNSISMAASTDDAEYDVENDLHGVDVSTPKATILDDLYDPVPATTTFYVMGKKGTDFGFFEYTGANMPASKAFLLLSGSNAPSLTMVFDNDATGIVEMRNEKLGMRNGNEEMRNGSAWYTLSGTRLSAKPTQPGLYIHNGLKVMVK